MKKRSIIIIAVIVIAVIVAALLIFTKPAAQPTSAKPGDSPVDIKPTEPVPEPGTVHVDKEKNISATIGVENVDSELEEEPAKVEPTNKNEKNPTPTPTPTPAPMPEEPAKTGYEQFISLSAEQKDEFMHSFESMSAFFDWLAAAQEEYKNAHPEIEIGPGDIIDLGELKP